MAGRKEVGVKRGEMRGLIIVSNAGDMTDCGPAKALHDGAVGIERNGRRIQETGNGRFRTGPVKAGKMVMKLGSGNVVLFQQSQSQQSCSTSALDVPTCPILLRLVTRTTSRTMAAPSFRCTVVHPVERRNYQSS